MGHGGAMGGGVLGWEGRGCVFVCVCVCGVVFMSAVFGGEFLVVGVFLWVWVCCRLVCQSAQQAEELTVLFFTHPLCHTFIFILTVAKTIQ